MTVLKKWVQAPRAPPGGVSRVIEQGCRVSLRPQTTLKAEGKKKHCECSGALWESLAHRPLHPHPAEVAQHQPSEVRTSLSLLESSATSGNKGPAWLSKQSPGSHSHRAEELALQEPVG